MHDLDRTQFELDPEDALGEVFETDGAELGYEETTLSEADEMELATELLEVTDEAELDQFLGKLFKKAGRFFKGPVFRSLGRMIKGVAKKALPMLGGALGTMIPIPGVGTALGSAAGSAAGKMFGLELEGMSDEDQEFEVARRVVRLAGDAAQKAASLSSSLPPQQAARSALVEAARTHAPGLVGGAAAAGHFRGRGGRWVRRGSKIILYGV